MSGAASGPFDCEGTGLFFLPPYKDDRLRGNTEVTLMSSARFQKGTPPPGVDLVTWAGVFRGALQPGTYTEKDLVPSGVDVIAVDLTGRKRISGLKRVKLVIKSISAEGVHDDVVTKRGPVRSDKIAGELELVIGEAADQVTIRATLK
jgi:hypothetical protein